MEKTHGVMHDASSFNDEGETLEHAGGGAKDQMGGRGERLGWMCQ